MRRILGGVAGLLLCLSAGHAAGDDWRLAGTLLHGEGAAVIETQDGQLLWRAGEVQGGCELLRVDSRSAHFRCGSVERLLSLGAQSGELAPPMAPDRPESEATVTLEHAAVLEELADRQRLVGGLTVEPVVDEGVIAGYRLLMASPGGLADRVGFRSGDIMRSVNGVPADRGSAFMRVLNELGQARQVLIGFERDGLLLQKVVLLN